MFPWFKIFFKKIFRPKNSFVFQKLNKNIETGELIEINGKQYRKIKITFVDSMSYTVSNHLENLESENNLLNEQILKANSEIQKLNEQIKMLQNYNNLIIHKYKCIIRDSSKRVGEIKLENELLNDRFDEMDGMISYLISSINRLNNQHQIEQEKLIKSNDTKIGKCNLKINNLQREISDLNKFISEQKVFIDNLVTKVANLVAKNNNLKAAQKIQIKPTFKDDL